jgi:hypothetical protein
MICKVSAYTTMSEVLTEIDKIGAGKVGAYQWQEKLMHTSYY